MVHHHISSGLKEHTLQLLERDIPVEVAYLLGMSTSSIMRWHANYENHGSVAPPKHLRGCPCLLKPHILAELCQLIEDKPTLYLDELRDWLAIYHDLPISILALHENLK